MNWKCRMNLLHDTSHFGENPFHSRVQAFDIDFLKKKNEGSCEKTLFYISHPCFDDESLRPRLNHEFRGSRCISRVNRILLNTSQFSEKRRDGSHQLCYMYIREILRIKQVYRKMKRYWSIAQRKPTEFSGLGSRDNTWLSSIFIQAP